MSLQYFIMLFTIKSGSKEKPFPSPVGEGARRADEVAF